MRLRSSIIVAVSVFVVLGLAFAWYSVRSAQAADASLTALNEKLVRLEVKLSQERERIAAGRQHVADLESRTESAKPRQAAATEKPPRPKDAETLMASDPNLRALYLNSYRAGLARRYGSMYRSLALTQTQIDKYEELATAHADDLVTLHADALAQGLKLSDPDVAALEKQSDGQFHELVGSEVGAPVVQQLINLDRISPMQHDANLTEMFIPVGSPPLTGEQETQLMQVLANASASYQGGGKADQKSINWDMVYDQAETLLSGVLTGSQLQAFKVAVEFEQTTLRRDQFDAQQKAGGH